MTTQSGTFRRMFLVLGISAVIFVAGCAGTKKKEDLGGGGGGDVGGGVPTAPAADENVVLGDSDSGKAMGLQTVNFPFDSFIFDATGKSNLQSNADILKANPNVKIQIEGHCDARGGIQYNIALGEKRANATQRFLEGLGISSDRMTVVSFGKEKPIDPGATDEAYAKNRRANFVITSH